MVEWDLLNTPLKPKVRSLSIKAVRSWSMQWSNLFFEKWQVPDIKGSAAFYHQIMLKKKKLGKQHMLSCTHSSHFTYLSALSLQVSQTHLAGPTKCKNAGLERLFIWSSKNIIFGKWEVDPGRTTQNAKNIYCKSDFFLLNMLSYCITFWAQSVLNNKIKILKT